MDRGARDALSLYVSGIGGIAFLLGLCPFVDLLHSIIGLMFGIAAVLGGVFVVIIRGQQGQSATFAIMELAIVGGFTFAMLYGIMWYFITYVPSQGTAWFNFQLVAPMPRLQW